MMRHKRAVFGFFAPLLLLIVLLAAGGEPLRQLLRFDRPGLGNGELWRWLSGHVVHLSWSHTVLNAAGLLVIAALFVRDVALREWYLALALAAVSISLGLWFWSPSLDWYVGLSGVLHGLFVLGAWSEWRHGHRSGLYLLLGVAAKLAYEQAAGALPMTASAAGGPVVVDAHLYGALGGALACVLMRAVRGDTHRAER
ncbi:MAG: rhombosortase [Gammaproteobacteria bacterium]